MSRGRRPRRSGSSPSLFRRRAALSVPPSALEPLGGGRRRPCRRGRLARASHQAAPARRRCDRPAADDIGHPVRVRASRAAPTPPEHDTTTAPTATRPCVRAACGRGDRGRSPHRQRPAVACPLGKPNASPTGAPGPPALSSRSRCSRDDQHRARRATKRRRAWGTGRRGARWREAAPAMCAEVDSVEQRPASDPRCARTSARTARSRESAERARRSGRERARGPRQSARQRAGSGGVMR